MDLTGRLAGGGLEGLPRRLFRPHGRDAPSAIAAWQESMFLERPGKIFRAEHLVLALTAAAL